MDLVLAWHAIDVVTVATNPASLHDGRPPPRLRHVPGQELAACATAKNQDFKSLRLRHAYLRVMLLCLAILGGQTPRRKASPRRTRRERQASEAARAIIVRAGPATCLRSFEPAPSSRLQKQSGERRCTAGGREGIAPHDRRARRPSGPDKVVDHRAPSRLHARTPPPRRPISPRDRPRASGEFGLAPAAR